MLTLCLFLTFAFVLAQTTQTFAPTRPLFRLAPRRAQLALVWQVAT